MLIDRYSKEDIFVRVPNMTQRIDPVLLRLDQLLDDDQLYQQVRHDFGQRHRWTLVHGRHSTPVEVLLRLLLLKHLFGWSYQQTEDRVDESLVLRWFARLYWQPTPDDTTLIRWANTLQPETLHQLNDRVVELARQARVTQGRKMRLDATCVQTQIHHPTDSGLLVDSVRVLSRLVRRAKTFIKDEITQVQQVCRSRLLTARRVAQTLRRKGEEKEAEQKALYQKLVETAEHMVQQASQVVAALEPQTEQHAQRLLHSAKLVLPLVQRVIAQTRSRVLEGKKVPSEQKVLSLFEPHTRAIPRHKGGALIEFGRQVIAGRASKAASSPATRFWSILMSMDRPWKPWHIMWPSSIILQGPWLGIEASTRPRPKLIYWPQASSGSPSRPRASSQKPAKPWNTHAVGNGAIAGARASRGELRASGATTAGARAAITGRTGWSGG